MKNNIRIIADAATDFPQEVLDRVNLTIIGINISFGEETYVGGVDIDSETFYSKMKASKELPKTSSPSPERFLEAYDCEEDEILVLTLTSKLSSTYTSANLAKEMYLEENPNKRIEVIDSENGTIGTACIVMKCWELFEQGKTMDEVLAQIDDIKKNSPVFGVLDTLENAIKGGRINKVAGTIINALNFKVVVKTEGGLVGPIDKARGEGNSLKKLYDYVNNSVEDQSTKTIMIGHSNCIKKAEKVKKHIEENYNYKEVLMAEIGPVMGTYTSEGAILLCVI